MKRLLGVLLALLLAAPSYAGRDCDGANDEIEFGSDASIDAFTDRTVCVWVRVDVGNTQVIVTKGATTGDALVVQATTEVARATSDWTTDGDWRGTADIVSTAFNHVCYTYNNSATTNDATLYVNGMAESLTTDTAPTGSWTSDATQNLQICESNADTADFDGNVAYLVYHNTILSAADINRARWWGRPFGGTIVYHPLISDKLTNEGTGTANGGATGTTVASSPVPVQRPSTALMNGGVGW